MNKREIILICIILCFICSCQAVMAADVSSNSTNTNVTSASTIEVVDSSNDLLSYSPSQDNETLGVGGGSFTELNNLIAGSTDSVITLDKNYTFVSGTDDAYATGILINKNVNISGNGYTIDASNHARAFRIAPANTVTLTGITFINGYSQAANGIPGQGGAVLGSGVVHIDNCKFIDNTAYYANGGAVCLVGSGSTITNSYFEGNKAIKSPNNQQSGGAGAVFINANNSAISHSTFIKNEAGLNGGAIGSSANYLEYVTITNCTISNNTAGGSAGGIGMQSKNFHITDSTFKYNEAKGQFTTYPGNGGAMVMRGWDSYAYNCTFIGNIAKQHGGAVFSTNTSYNPLNNNTGFELCTFIDNIAGYNGGAADWAAGANHGYIIDSIFTNNTAKRSGGAVHWSGHYGTVSNSTFINNNATGDVISEIGGVTGGGDGGAIVWIGSHGIINNNSNFTNNFAKYRGGAVFLHGNSTENCDNTTVTNTNFKDNVAGLNGGAIDWQHGATNGMLSYCNFTNNVAWRSGGAVYWNGINGNITYCNFDDNHAIGNVTKHDKDIVIYSTGGGNGGAIIWTGSNGYVDNSNFTKNTAKTNGGAVYLQKGTYEACENTTFDSCIFTENEAGINGGAVDWNSGSHKGNIFYSTFTNNIANSNGGAVFWSGHDGEILHSNFTNNYAKGNVVDSHGNIGDGGAIIWSGLNGTVINCSFVGNNASMRGGAVYLQNCSHGNCTNTTFSNVYFKENTAGTNGGAIDWHEGAEDGHLLYAVFEQNTAKRSGGAIYWNGKNGEIKHSNFTGNKALGTASAKDAFGNITYGGDGGAVIWIGSEGEVDNCTFEDNEAAKRGGAVYLQANGRENCSNTNFTNSEFIRNTAGTNGGAIDWNKGAHNGLVENVTFVNNTAKRSGGAVYWNGEYGDIIRANFTGNRALGIANASDAFNVVTYGGDGGAVIWIGSYGSVDDCRFEDNVAAKRGGAVYLQGTIDANCTDTNFTDSYFKNNTAGTNGGAIDWNKGAHNGIVYNVTFIDNTANRSGGAIYWNGHNGTISWSKFYNNTALGIANATTPDGKVTYGGDGGAIIWSGALGDVEYSNFVNNTAAKRGGAIFLQGSETEPCENTTFKDSYFAHNVAGTNGGAIDWFEGAQNGLVDNVTFINNTAKRNGGAIFWHGDNGTVKNSKFNNNRATGTSWEYIWAITREDIILYNESHEDFLKTTPTADNLNKLYVINETLSDNRDYFVSYVAVKNATGDGYHWEKLDETIILLSDSIISPVDWATDQYFGGDGGTILWSGDIGLIENCTFIDSNSARRGGGAYMTGSDYVTFDDCYFENCTSGTNGGGVDWLAGANYGKIHNTIFNNTRAARSAGAIYYDGDYGEIINITIINATSNGGSLKVSKDGLVNYAGWDSSHWDTNTTGGDAGAIMITGDHLYIYNATFTDCISVGRGGAVFLQDNKNATFELCIFEGNYAKGIANNTWANYTQERNDDNEDTKVNYKLTGHGGAISFDVNAKDCKIIDVKFYNNGARRNGGAINFDQGSTNNTIKNSEFINNTVYDDGGAINFDHGADLCTVSNVIFYNNTALGKLGSTSKGGTICLVGNNVTIENSKFTLGNVYADTGAKDNETWGGAMFVTGNYTVIKNTTFENCFALEDGGALYVIGDDCKMYNSSFKNNHAGDDGGAIYWEGDYGFMYNITCSNNTVTGKTKTSAHSKGGTLALTGNNAVVDKSRFELSSAIFDGGAIYATGNYVNITNSEFEKCMVTQGNEANQIYGGGSIFLLGNYSNILNCSFQRSNAKEGGVIYVQGNNANLKGIVTDFTYALNGGAFYIKGANATISESSITRTNATKNYGGSIYVEGVNAVINTTNFTMNFAKTNGGSIYVKGVNATIDKSRFNMTSAAQHGGAIYISGKNALINNSNISMSNASYSGGAIYIQGLSATIENSAFSDTLAKLGSSFTGNSDPTKATPDNTNMGGAIYIGDNYAKIRNSSFTNSAAYYGGILFLQGQFCDVINSSLDKGYSYRDGGAYFSKGINSNVYDSNFTNNVARNDGGALFWLGSKYNYVNGSIFTNNTAKGDPGHSTKGGGAIYFAEGGSYCGISYSKFFNNSAVTNSKADGGAILWDKSSHIFIDHCLFDGNFVNSTSPAGNWIQGGVLYARPGTNLTISNNIFQNCWSLKEAGALYLQTGDTNGVIELINNTFINNTAYGNTTENDNFLGGGAVLSKSVGKLIIVNATFINNTANYGGGITIHSSVSQCSITNATFDGNKATIGTGCGDGGSIYAKKAFTANNLIMSNGEAARNGGGMYVSNVEMTYNNFTFINNSAANGGGLYWDRAGVTIEDMTFINNSAVISGGAIFIPAGSSTSSWVYVLNNIFTGNSANSGGAIYAIGNSIIISQNNFTNNSASYRGGAIFIPVSNNGVDIGYSNFTGNKAAADGGAIFIGSKGYDNRKIHDCNFINNSAVDDGGAIYVANINKEIINCYFDGNKADGDGGAVYVAAVQGGKITDSTFTNSLAQNGGAVYYAGTTNVAGALKIVNDTFLKNIAIYNGGAVLYLVGNGPDKYRDYNNFDGIGIPVDGGRTTVKANNTNVEFISTSLFEYNEDYMLRLRVISDWLNPYITVYIDNPRDWNRYGLRVVMKLINSTTHEEIRTIIINESNIDTHRRDGMIYASFDNLIKNETYNITVSFEDYNYLYKVNSTVAQAHGEIIGEFKLLQKLIDEAIDRGDKELVLNRTFTFTPFYEGKHANMDDRCINLTNIPYAFTIRGEGFVIDAAGYSRIFNITSSNVTIDNVILVGGNASGEYGDGIDMGGAIFWAGPNGIISNSIIEHNNATIGGGIYYNVTAPDCQIINTTFVENTAVTHGGAIDCNASRMGLFNTTFDGNFAYIGAALCREINATEGHGKNNTFIGNYAEYAGAALAWINATLISIDDYHFYNNHVGYSGGAIYVGEGSKNCEILNCIFDNNWVENETDGHGGAIEWYSEKGLVYNSEFTNNRAYDGGAIYVGSASGEINITKSTFHDNIAVTTGGAISINASAVTVNASNFYNNNATRGGALFVGGVGTDNYIYGSVFEGNNAISTTETAMNGLGGAIDWVASSGTIVDTRFTDNHADYGGGVYFGENSINSRIENCLFEGNDAKYNGGAIDCNASSMYLTNTVFDGNVAQFGAALCRETNAKSGSGANNTFKNNHAIVVGAALGWMGSVGINITNYTFINNSADVAGGAIYVSPTSHNCSVIDCNFVDNYVTNKTNGWTGGEQFSWTAWDGTDMTYVTEWTTNTSKIATADVFATETIFYYNTQEDIDNALGNGGAITIYGANATVENTNFTGSSARLGGAIYVGATSGHTILNHTIFTSNVALERGGAVNLHASGVHIDDGKFYDNLAVNGSAIYVGGLGTENKVHDSIFRGNNATDYGGAIYWVAYVGEIYNSEFTQNNARWGGGIYFNGNSANTNVVNSTFKSNSAVKNGGAIECNASNIGIYNLTFEENIAGEYGAALCREINATGGHGTNNTFISNHAGISGAALAWMGVTDIHIVDYKFRDNTAESSGGAIFIDKGSNNDIIENCTFEGNHLTNLTEGHNGGAIDCRGENLTIDYVDFTNNGAYTGGAVYMASDSKNIRIFDSNFTSNYAMGDGGALGLKAESLTINNTIFKSNTAVRHGGALYAGGNGTNNTIRYTTFEDNRAGDHGGAIDWLSSAGIFEYINFRANTAEYGGGIYLNGVSSNSKLNSVYFIENRATKNGGAIDCNASMMGLNNTIFISNYAGEYGAALCREANATGGFGGNNSFIKNHAEIAGAALAWLGVDGININNYKFINNTADLSGGAIYVRGDSPNCKVRNSYFENNRVNDVQNGQGGAIDWLGENGYIYNSTFIDSFAHNGGTLFITSNNMNITLSNFTGSRALGEGGVILLMSNNTTITDSIFEFSVALERGGVISAYDAYNATISDCKFDSNVAAGYIDSSNRYYGDGGTISWINGNNLKIINSEFNDTQAHAYGGSLYIVNVNDSSIFNTSFNGMFAVQDGGAIYWGNSTNVTIDLCNITSSSATYRGGAIYVENINDARIINSNFDDVSTPWGNGGTLYIDGNVTLYNDTFTNFKASTGYAGAIYFCNGNSTLSNSSFDGIDAIWINKDATLKMTKNNITADIKNKNTTYLTTPYNIVTNPVPYSVWNDGNLTLDKNNFDCLIFNDEGIIDSPTVIKILDNTTVYADWNSNFTFWASIYDDNNNTIISVSKLNTTNDVVGGWYPMSYNAWTTQVYYNGTFHISGKDVGLPNAVVYNGTLNVLVETTLPLDVKQVNEGEHVTITATVPQDPNTITGNVTFVVNGETYIRELVKGIATLDLYNLTANTYHVTATYSGDKNHFECQNTTQFIVNLRDTWVIISIQNYTYGILGCANVTSNGNGTIRIYFNGRYEDFQLVNGTFNLTFDQILDPGLYWMSVTYIEDGYYKYAMNQTSFEVYWLNTTINATPTNIKYGENELINVTVDKNATGYIVITIDNHRYLLPLENGTVLFNISGLAPGKYENISVIYSGDTHFLGNSTNITFTVSPTGNFTIDVKVNNITYGQNATIRVLVATDAVGNVTIYVDGVDKGTVNLTNGVATLDVADLVGGDHVVNVTYNGGPRYAPKDKNNTVFNVGPNTSWKVTITDFEYNPYGEYSKINITDIPQDIKGENLTIKIDGVSYVVPINRTTNSATLRLNNLSAGLHSATVNYDGDENYGKISQEFRPSIPQATPTITLTQNGTDLIATVSGNTTGNVTFYTRGNEYTIKLVNGNATLKNNLTFGLNDVVAIYNGDKNYTSARIMETFEIEKQNVTITIKDITSVIYVGNKVIFNATLNETVTGDVVFTINGVNYTVAVNNANVATYTYTPVNNATLTVVATFNGNDKYNRNSSAAKQFNVAKIATDIDVAVKVPVKVGEDAVITVTMNPSINTTVTLTVDGKEYYVAVVNGKGGFNASGLNSGIHKVNVTYAGDYKYIASNDTTTFTMGNATLDVNVTALNVTVKENTSFVINVTDKFNGNVSIKVGDDVLYNGTVEALVIGNILPVAGDKVATVVFYGDDNYDELTLNNVRFTVSRVTPEISVVVDDVTYPAKTVATITVGNKANGTVNITVDGKKFKGTVTNGVGTIDLEGLSAGAKVASVEFFSTDDYSNNVTASAKFNINKNTSGIGIDVKELYKVGDDIVITLTPVNSTGAVTVTINGKEYTVTNNVITIDGGLPAGEYIVNAVLAGDENYTGSGASKTFNVEKRDITVNLDDVTDIKVGTPVTFTAELNETVTGDVVFTINGVNYTVAVSNADVATYTYTPLNNATLTVVATFNGNDKFNKNSSAVKQFNVGRISTDINVTTSPIYVGENAVFDIEMNPSINTTVTLKVDGETYDVAIINGKGSFNVSGLANKTYEINVIFVGDDKYMGVSNVTTLKVNKLVDYNINVTVGDINFGENETIVIVLPADVDPTKLVVKVNGTEKAYTIVNGVATVVVPGLSAGKYEVNVTYTGDDKYASKNNNSNIFKVNPSATYDIILAVENHTYGENTIFTVTLPNDVTENVTIKIDGKNYSVKPNANGVATLTLNNISGGLHTFAATYGGDGNYSKSSKSTTFVIGRAASSIDVNFTTPKLVDDKVLINVSMGQKINGTVILTVGDNNYTVVITNGNGSYVISGVVNTTYAIKAVFAGNENYTASTSTIKNLAVNKVPIEVDISLDKSVINVGENAVVTVELNQTINTTVAVKVNGKEYIVGIVNGKGSLNLSDLANATYTINATFKGDAKYLTNSSSILTLKVNKVPTEIDVTVKTPITYGSDAVISIELNATINTTVKLSVDGKLYDVAIVKGKGSFNASGLTSGKHEVNVTYAGDDKYVASNDTAIFTVGNATLNVNVTAQNVTVEQNTTFIIDVVDFNGNVSISVDGDVLYNGTVKGIIGAIKLLAGDKVATVVFYGDDNYDKLTLNNVKFTVSRVTPEISVVIDDVTYPAKTVATITVGNKANGTVNITVDGKKFKGTVTNGVGTIDLEGLSAGAKVASVEFFSTDDYNNNVTASAKFNINKNTSGIGIDVKELYKVGDDIVITLTPVNSTGAVTVTINGKEYTVTNNVITIDGGLPAGEYIVNAVLAGDENYTGSDATKIFNVEKRYITVNLDDATDIKVGTPVTFTSRLNETVTGDVVFTINGVNYTVAVSNADVATYTYTPLNNATLTVVATFNGNNKFNKNSSAAKVFNVDRIATDIVVTSNSPIYVGDDAVISIELDAAINTTVSLNVGGKMYNVAIINGKGSFNLSNFANDTYDVKVTFAGNDKYGESANDTILKVNKISDYEIKVNANDIKFGENATIVVILPADVDNADLIIKVDGDVQPHTMINGVVTISVPHLHVGEHEVNVTYIGDNKYSLKDKNGTKFKVNPTPTYEIILNVDNHTYGEDTTFKVTLPHDVTENVTISIDGKSYSVKPNINGIATLTLNNISGGLHAVTAIYPGDDEYAPNSKSATFVIGRAESSIDVEFTTPKLVGEDVLVNVVMNQNINTTVTLSVGVENYTVSITNGKGSYTIKGLANTTYDIKAVFIGNENYTGSASTIKQLAVNKLPIEIDISLDKTSMLVGENAVVSIELNETIDAIVSVKVNNNNYNVAVVDGKGTITLDGLTKGTYIINAEFAGNDKYLANTSNVLSLNVDGKNVTEVSVDVNLSNKTIKVDLPENATGNITVKVDGVEYDVTNVTGTPVIIDIGDIAPGNHTVEVIYSGDGNYTSASNMTYVEIPKVTDYLINITSSDIIEGQTENLNIELNIDVDGVVVEIDGKKYYVDLTNGKGSLKVDGLTNNTYTAIVKYLGDATYDAKSNNTVFTVKAKKDTSKDMHVDVTIPENSTSGIVNVTLPDDATGNVTVVIDGKVYNITNVTNGTAVVYIDNIIPGNHTVEVIYSGDDNYTNASSTIELEIPKQSDYEMSVDAVVNGRDVDITVNLPEDIDGIVLINVGGVGYYANATNGNAKLHLSDVDNGKYDVTAKYLGDDYYAPGENTTSFTVDAKIKPEVEISVDIPENSTNGTIAVEVPDDATGNVTVVIDGKVYNVTEIVNGTAVIPVDNLTPGNHTVEVIYSGDDNYSPASNATVVNVPKVKDYPMDVTANDINVGDKTDIIVTLPEDINGVVLVDIDGIGYYVNVTDGIAKVNLPLDLKPGTYDVVVTFPGNDKYDSKQVSDSFKVVSKTTDVDIKIDGDKIVVELPEDATGNVTVTIDGKPQTVPVKDGKAVVDISDLEPGNHTIEVVYSGDDKYGPGSNSTVVEVPKISDYPVSIDKDGDKLVVSVPDDATGDVTVSVDGKDYTVPIRDGKAVVDISDLAPGNHDVKVTYPGDDKYAPVTNSTTINVPKKSDYPIDITTDGDKLVVSVPDDATGDVTVSVDGKDYTVPIKDGKAVVDISDLPSGTHDVKVTYPGNDKYDQKTVSTSIVKERSLVITAPDVVKYYSGPDRFVVYTKDSDGNNLSGIEVKITINGQTYTRTTKDGKTSLALNLNSGNYTVKVEFAGNDEFKPQTINANVEVLPTIYAKDVLKVFRNGTHYYALFVDGEGNPLANTEVKFNIHGVFYTRTTNATGWAKLNLNLEKGHYILTAINPVTGEMRTNNVTIFTLIESSDLVKYYRNGSQFIVRVRAADGGWAQAGENVTFNIHGVFYTRTTNATGHVRLPINIEPGEYLITSYYKDCRESNKITVLPRLITSDVVMKYRDGTAFVAKTLDEQGNSASHQQVSFNINGILYNRTTNDQGEAKINLNLQPGEYIITSEYGFEKEGNTIKIEA